MNTVVRTTLFLALVLFISGAVPGYSIADDNEELLKDAKEDLILFTPSSIKKAIENYYKVLEANPKSADAYAGLAESYSLLGHYNKQIKKDYEEEFNKAHSFIVKALQLDRNNSNVQRALGYYYLHLSREKDTARVAEQLLKKNSNDYEAMYLSWAADGKNPDDERIHKVLDKKPKLIAAHVDLAESYFYRKRRYSRAAEQISRAIEIKDSSYLRDMLGTIYRNQHAYDKSIDEFKNALKMDSSFAPSVMNYGISLYYKNKVNDSIDQLTRSLEINPRFPETYFYLAKNYQRKGDSSKTKKYYTDFLKMAGGESKYYGMIMMAKQSLNGK